MHFCLRCSGCLSSLGGVEPCAQRGLKGAGALGVKPVSRLRDFGKAGLGEERLDLGAVLARDVVRIGPCEKECGASEAGVDLGETENLRHIGLKRR